MQTKGYVTPRLVSCGSSPRARLRLFCFPYAGGAAHILHQSARWRELTTVAFALHMLPGEHFFLHTSQDMLPELVTRQLERPRDGAA